jgi:hypothetical protein
MLFEDENDQPTLKVCRDAQGYRPIEIVRRMILRDPNMTTQEAQRLASAAGLRISPMVVSHTVADMRACYKAIAEAGLLRRDADDRRREIEDDLVEIAPKRRLSSAR